MKTAYFIALAAAILAAATGAQAQPRSISIGQAPAHLKYLSPRCAALNDALRTAQSRGLKYETIIQMQREYGQECAENESEANSRVWQERKDKKEKLVEAKKAENLDRERSQIHDQQCGESKRILYNKRARKDLTEGEKADLQRFEENYHSRCG